MTNFFKYVHAPRDMAAHLTRRVKHALPMFTKNTILGQVSVDFHLQYVKVIIKLTEI